MPTTKADKRVPVSPRAIVQRINRKLRPDLHALKKCKVDSRGYRELGDYYIVDQNTNFVVDTHVDIEQYARTTNLMGQWERMADDE